MSAVVRRAGEADVDAAASVLADAFTDYPWTRWTVDADNHVQRIRDLQRLVMERVVLRYGEVWVAVDDDEIVAVAMWGLPDVPVPPSVWVAMEGEQARLEGARHDASKVAEEAVSHLHPSERHYFLGTVGTRRARQRHGFGAAVLAPVLERATSEDTIVYLETSSPENVAFYLGLGFVTTTEIDVPEGGPHVWAMTRTARA